ncbi:hypothetical protein FOA52_004059 [Chlamydomonas sp. UWO 241]|nr:hypothetical protein FOA52_004059 [Chlamydomonas sp. UWO 241]
MGLLSLFHGKKQVSPLDDDDDMGGPGALRNNERRARSEGGDGKQGRHGKDKQAGRAESYSKKKKKKRVIVMKFEAFMEVLLSKFEVFKRKHPSTFKAVMFVAMILEEGLYVYDLYTDVVVAKGTIVEEGLYVYDLYPDVVVAKVTGPQGHT